MKEFGSGTSQAALLVKVGLHGGTGPAEKLGVPLLRPNFVLQRAAVGGAVCFQALASCGREGSAEP